MAFGVGCFSAIVLTASGRSNSRTSFSSFGKCDFFSGGIARFPIFFATFAILSEYRQTLLY